MKNLLDNLRPTDADYYNEDEGDEDIQKVMNRRVSMNEQNVIGMNFEKYIDQKPSGEIRRKIANFF